MNNLKQKINPFLHFGYFPNFQLPMPESLQQWIDGTLTSPDFSNTPISELIKIGVKTLRTSIKETLGNDHNKIHVVPLSGGLDSRTVLANIIEHIAPSKIYAVTFGTPGSYDYETGKRIAKKAKVKWEGIDLSPGKWKWNNDLLINTARLSEYPNKLFDCAVNYSVRLKYGIECIYWTGFMGDTLSMIKPFSVHIKTWEQAKSVFAKEYCNCKNYNLTTNSFSPEKCLPEKPFTIANRLNYYSQLYNFIRQPYLIKNNLSPINYITRHTFLSPKWVSFILSVPVHYRIHQLLYRKILKTTWPNLFNTWNSPYRYSSKIVKIIQGGNREYINYSIKKIFRHWTSKTPLRNVNYIDWNWALRYQDDFKYVVYSNIQDLKSRKIIDWLDIDKVWASHQNLKMDLANELLILAALEIHLKAGTIK